MSRAKALAPHAAGFVVLAASLLACTETPVSVPLRSLERSGEVSFVCADHEGNGRDIDACPDFDSQENPRHLLALVTQTLRGEVAVVDLSLGKVVDLDHSTPGYNFLSVGDNPVDIVSTPGGVASFVGVASPGKEGIFALPTTCARPPAHDLTAWSACALPAAPGEMAIVIDPPAADDDGNPATPAPVRASCSSAPSAAAAQPGSAIAASRSDCPADLALESSPPGRRKLIVSLPALGGYALIDAQGVLDREPGSYQPCDIEYFFPLATEVAEAPVQKVPADLQAPGCVLPEINYGKPPDSFTSLPGGIDVSDGRLFVSDRGVPAVHVIDVSDPCSPVPNPPLLPVSFEARNRVVTTSQVAVSPPTSDGSRFAYAVDETEGSVMIFDVTPGHSDRTPLVRPGAPRLPFEPADRVAFSAPARDVSFALRDAPIADPETGVATVGTLCDPDPGLPSSAPGAKYRPNHDYSKGAAPRNLRGTFGFVMLSSGQVVVIDVEDYDAACRRPIRTNSATADDFRGCAGDAPSPEYLTSNEAADGKRTVSGEVSCRVVEPHRTRSGRLMVNSGDVGVNAPSLRSLPRLTAPGGGNLPTDQSDEGKQYPKLLAVEHVNPKGGSQPVEVHIGTDLYTSISGGSDTGNVIDIAPASATRPSVALLYEEPRAFGGDEEMKLVYEGAFIKERKTGFPKLTGNGKPDKIQDADGAFCNNGVEDMAYAAGVAASLGVAGVDAFARAHADVLAVTQPLPSKDAGYWQSGIGSTCGGAQGKAAYFVCREAFGPVDAPTALRDFTVVEAYQNELVIEPRSYSDEADRDRIIELLHCCFGAGSAISYEVRAGSQWLLTGSGSGYRHRVAADQNLRCVEDCNPRRQFLTSRAFEAPSEVCSGESGPLAPTSKCVFQNLTHRFAVYRGSAASKRDMMFSWTVTGGFTPLAANLTAQSRAVSPQSLSFVPQIGQLAVVDGASEGLVLISLDSVSVARLFF